MTGRDYQLRNNLHTTLSHLNHSLHPSEAMMMTSKHGHPPRRRRILVYYIGGTIGMKREYEPDGPLRPTKGYLSTVMANMQEIQQMKEEVVLKEAKELLDSSDMGPESWLDVAFMIRECYDEFDGFVVIMGTDTMAYISSAVSFLLENLSKPVVFTGAMVPYDQGGFSDSRRNLLLALYFAALTDPIIPEVLIFFGNHLFRANRTKKIASNRFEAFASPNYPAIATVGVKAMVDSRLILSMPRPGLTLKCNDKLETRIAVVHLIPFYDNNAIYTMLDTPGLRAVVFSLYGAGNAPLQGQNRNDPIQHASKRGILCCITSQCLIGSVELETYANGKAVLDAGAVSCLDMTLESVVTKLSVLFGKGLSSTEVARLLPLDVCGESTIHHGGSFQSFSSL